MSRFVLFLSDMVTVDPSPDRRFARKVGEWVVGGRARPDGGYDFETTPDLSLARRFDTGEAAFEFWRQGHPFMPLRPDGKPNKPWTCYTIEIRREDETSPPIRIDRGEWLA